MNQEYFYYPRRETNIKQNFLAKPIKKPLALKSIKHNINLANPQTKLILRRRLEEKKLNAFSTFGAGVRDMEP